MVEPKEDEYMHNRTFNAILSIPLINCQSLDRAEIRRFQSERFVFTIQFMNTRYKIFQIVFGKSDGSIYASFPYFDIKEGIVSVGTVPALLVRDRISFETCGRVTSQAVKYAHHPDGKVHFSQTGKVIASIRRNSLPLRKANGHLFSVHAQGLSHFDTDPFHMDHPPGEKRTVLNFKVDEMRPEAFKIVARWYDARSLIKHSRGYSFGPTAHLETPNGHISPAFLIGPPKGSPMEKHVLIVSCDVIPALDRQREGLLAFIGGFDHPKQSENIALSTSFLWISYPVTDYKDLLGRIGTIDIDPNDFSEKVQYTNAK